MRNVIAVITAILLLNANAFAKVHEPTSVDATNAEISAPLEAAYAILIIKDKMGQQRPVCVTNVVGRPDLVPKPFKPASEPVDIVVKLPPCAEQQVVLLEQAKDHLIGTEQAALPAVAGAACLTNAAIAAGLVIASSVSQNRLMQEYAGAFAIGLGTGREIANAVTGAAKVGFGALGFACSSLGVSVAYWLFPPRRY